jgi:hypothetical protein
VNIVDARTARLEETEERDRLEGIRSNRPSGENKQIWKLPLAYHMSLPAESAFLLRIFNAGINGF